MVLTEPLNCYAARHNVQCAFVKSSNIFRFLFETHRFFVLFATPSSIANYNDNNYFLQTCTSWGYRQLPQLNSCKYWMCWKSLATDDIWNVFAWQSFRSFSYFSRLSRFIVYSKNIAVTQLFFHNKNIPSTFGRHKVVSSPSIYPHTLGILWEHFGNWLLCNCNMQLNALSKANKFRILANGARIIAQQRQSIPKRCAAKIKSDCFHALFSLSSVRSVYFYPRSESLSLNLCVTPSLSMQYPIYVEHF